MNVSSVNKMVPYGMLVIGIIFLVASAFYMSYVASFAGLGLTFWGALLLYLSSSRYVKLELLSATASSALSNMEKALAPFQTGLKGVYLPPNRLQDYTSSLVYLPTQPNQPLPTSEETNPRGLVVASERTAGLLITPPGLALSKLFEKQLNKSFTEFKIEDLQRQLPKLFEQLEITKSMTIRIENDIVIAQMKNHIFEDICDETRKLERTHVAVGCPLSSALACALAKATGKPVTIDRDFVTADKKRMIRFKILGDQ